MGISRDSLHKKRSTGGCKSSYMKKRKHCLARPKTLTKIGAKRVRTVRTRGGHEKKRALRLDSGNFSWGSESITRKARITDVVYHPSDNEFIRTKTVVKSSIVQIDANPFKNWYQSYYNTTLGKKKDTDASATKTVGKKALEKFEQRQKLAKVEPAVEDQFTFGKLYACISSRPGQCGRADGYVLEGKELEFYLKKIKSKKNK